MNGHIENSDIQFVLFIRHVQQAINRIPDSIVQMIHVITTREIRRILIFCVFDLIN